MPPVAAAAPIIGALGTAAIAGKDLFGGGPSSSSAPTTSGTPQTGTAQVYTPQFQPQLDEQYNAVVQDLIQQINSGSTPPQLAQGQFNALTQGQQDLANQAGGLTQNIVNNPYFNQQLAGVTSAADWTQSQLDPLRYLQNYAATSAVPTMGAEIDALKNIQQQQTGLANQTAALAPTLTGLSNQAAAGIAPTQNVANLVSGLVQPTANLGQTVAGTLPQYQGLADALKPAYGQSQALTNQIAGNIPGIQNLSGQIAGLMGPTLAGTGDLLSGARNLMTTGYDPQGALFNQLTAQTRDQANALNAQAGLAGTPYATGLTGDALRNFDINWQNQQLQRQAEALQGAGTALNQRAGIINTAGGLGGQAISGLKTAADVGTEALGGLTTGGALQKQIADLLTGMGGQATTAGGLYGTAGTLGGQAGNLYGQAANIAGTAGDLTTQAGGMLARAGTLDDLARGTGVSTANIAQNLPATAAASTTGAQGLQNLQAGAAGLPAQTLQNQLQAGTTALSNQQGMLNQVTSSLQNAVNNGQLTQQQAINILNALGNYIRLGQGSSLAASQAGQLATNQQTQGLSGLTQLANQLSSPATTNSLNNLSNSLFGTTTAPAFANLGGDTNLPVGAGGTISGTDIQRLSQTDPTFFG